ncbi:MAG TPA: acyltransferase family protein [Acidimicrobiales bacterium]|nr:acyltransferase family protein [Acidimicrobiales bacterium]
MQTSVGTDDASTRPRLTYVPGLDGLRGAAVAAVLAFHAGHLKGGYLGVDLFFVLSGYLITSLLLLEGAGSGHIGLVRFWGRRARRLLPALGVMLAGVAVYAWVAADPGELHRIRWDGLATLAYVANWRQIFAQVDYFALFAAPSPLEHTWSLAIEEQFYVIWPLVFVGLVAMIRRRDANRGTAKGNLGATVMVLSLALGTAAVALQVVLGHFSGWTRVYFGTDTRAFAILAGAAVAGYTAWRGPVPDGAPRRVLEVAALVGAVALAVAWTTMDGSGSLVRQGGLAACSVAGALVVAAVAQPRETLVAKALAVAPLRWLGLISYGVYLYHWPIDVWLSADRTGLSGWTLIALQLAVTLAVSVLSYRLIEQPIRHGRSWPRVANLAAPAVGAAALAVLIIASTATSAFDRLGPSDPLPATAAEWDGPTTMIVGDSVAWYLGDQGFADLQTEPFMRFVNDAYPGCAFPTTDRFRYPDGSESDEFTASCDREWLDRIAEYDASRVVFVLGGSVSDEPRHDGRFLQPCSTEWHDYYVDELSTWVRRFAGAGAHTYVVTMPSALDIGTRPRDIVAANQRSADCGNQAMKDVAAADPGNVTVIDLQTKLCPADGTGCAMSWGDVTLRPDTVHFKGASARLVADWILDQMGVDVTGR